jgi:hypothetical protein
VTDTNARGRYAARRAFAEGACTHRMDLGDVPSIDGLLCLGLCDDVVTVQAWCWAVAGWALWSLGAGLGAGCLAGSGP